MMGCRRIDNREYAAMYSATDTRGKALLALGCQTGLRISELLSLTCRHVRKGGRLKTRVFLDRNLMKGKYRGRVVYIGPKCKAILRRWIKRKKSSPWLFPGNAGKQLSRSHAHRIITRAAVLSGIDPTDVGPHSMRKKFAYDAWIHFRKNVTMVQVILGHADIRSTMKYLECCDEENLWAKFIGK